MITLEELNEAQMLLTNIIYQAHQQDKNTPAQLAYQHLANMRDIGLGRARQEINKRETYEEGFRALHETINDYASQNPDFTEEKVAVMKLEEFTNSVALVFNGFRKPFTSSVDKPVIEESIDSLKRQLADAHNTIKQWESGWLSAQSLSNAKLRKGIREIATIAKQDNDIEILQIIDRLQPKLVNQSEE